MDLIQMLMSQLGIDESQAKGGAGLIFNMIKEKLGDDDFKQVQDAVPDVQGMIDFAPTDAAAGGSGDGGLMGMIGKLLGGGGGQLGDLAKLAGGFKSLGLSTDSITKFIPVIMKFVESQGGDTVKAILAQVLGGKK